jgi:NitT/TauT family transport system substrate-binding protein
MTAVDYKRLGAVLVLLAALVAASTAGARPTARSRDQVTIGYLLVEPAMQAAYAQARGYFAAQGIDAVLKPFTDPGLIPPAVLSRDVTFSSFNVGGVAYLKSLGAPVKIVAGGALYQPHTATTAIMSAPGKTFTRPSQLVGKKIGIDAKKTIAHIGLLRWLKQGGVSEGDVTLVEFHGFATMLDPLKRGQIDAAVMPEPYVTEALGRGSHRVAMPFDATCRSQCMITGWMARKDVDPGLAARFRNAIQAASVWADQKKNQAASGKILADQASLDSKLVGRIARTTFAVRLRPALAQPWVDAFAEFGVYSPTFPALDLVK